MRPHVCYYRLKLEGKQQLRLTLLLTNSPAGCGTVECLNRGTIPSCAQQRMATAAAAFFGRRSFSLCTQYGWQMCTAWRMIPPGTAARQRSIVGIQGRALAQEACSCQGSASVQQHHRPACTEVQAHRAASTLWPARSRVPLLLTTAAASERGQGGLPRGCTCSHLRLYHQHQASTHTTIFNPSVRLQADRPPTEADAWLAGGASAQAGSARCGARQLFTTLNSKP